VEDALYASPRYLERAGAPARLGDLAAHRCVLFRATRGRAAWTLQGPSGDETVEVQGSLTVDELSFARDAVAERRGRDAVAEWREGADRVGRAARAGGLL
jgi:hypothetical protein